VRSLFDDTGRGVASLVGAESRRSGRLRMERTAASQRHLFQLRHVDQCSVCFGLQNQFPFSSLRAGVCRASSVHGPAAAAALHQSAARSLESRADASPDGVLDMEACLGDASFSDALSHLAVLASAHLHSRLERADHGFDVDMLDDEARAERHHRAARRCCGAIEIETLKNCMRPVFQAFNSNTQHCPLVVVTGSLALASRSWLTTCSAAWKSVQSQRGRGRSRCSCGVLFEDAGAGPRCRARWSAQDGPRPSRQNRRGRVGLCRRRARQRQQPPRLRQFLLQKRFVIVADDADTEGCSELLLHVPLSNSALRFGPHVAVWQRHHPSAGGQPRSGDLVRIQLQRFEPEVSMQLVDSVAATTTTRHHEAACSAWLSQVLEDPRAAASGRPAVR